MHQIQVSCPPAHPLPTDRAGPVGAWCPPSIVLWSVSLPREPCGPAQRWPLWICPRRRLPSASQSGCSIFPGTTCGGTPHAPHGPLLAAPLVGSVLAYLPPSPHFVQAPTFPLLRVCHPPAPLNVPHGGEGALRLGLRSPRPTHWGGPAASPPPGPGRGPWERKRASMPVHRA